MITQQLILGSNCIMLMSEKLRHDWMYQKKDNSIYRNVVGSFMDEMSTFYSAVVRLVYDYNISRKAGTHTVLFLGLV